MYGNTDPGADTDANGGLYGAGRFGYSINQFSASVAVVDSGSATWDQVDYDAELSASIAAGTTYSFITVSGSQLTRPDYKGVRAFVATSGSYAKADLLPQYTAVAANGTDITFVFENTAEAVSSVVVTYNQQPADNQRGDFEIVTGKQISFSI